MSNARIDAIIDGRTIENPTSANRIAVENPATEEVIETLGECDAAQVDAAVMSARNAFEAGVWRKASVETRQQTMRTIADCIDREAEKLAELETRNTGIPLSQSRERHVARAAYNFRFFAEYIGQTSGELYEQNPDYLTLVRREPVGVAALIAPWNAPIALGSMKLAAAIAFGNSCVIKPSELAPLGVSRLVQLLHDAGLPKGVVNLVNGRGPATGDALVRHPDVNLVSFTGGTDTGRIIAGAAGERLIPVTMELGGKSANIIFADADLDAALDGALAAIYSNNGQQCLAGSRILIAEEIADAFIAKFVERTAQIVVGDPMSAQTRIGPLASAAQKARVLEFAQTADQQGLALLAGGKSAAGFTTGHYVEPTVMRARDMDFRVCREEVFGPLAVFLTFKSEEEAYEMANDTRFGLVAYVWSQDFARVQRAQEALSAGTVWVNMTMMRELRAPFGGYKDSGIGAEGGRSCEEFYSQSKTVSLPRNARSKPG